VGFKFGVASTEGPAVWFADGVIRVLIECWLRSSKLVVRKLRVRLPPVRSKSLS
jgi:hypothetical protein